MDIYVSTSPLDYDQVVEGFESVIWTERYADAGEFEMTFLSSSLALNTLSIGKYLLSSESRVVMMIETKDDTEPGLVKISGRSLTAMLKYRANPVVGSTVDRQTGTYKQLMRYYVNRHCINPATAGATNVFPSLSLPDQPTTGVTNTVEVRRGTIFDIVKSLADAAGLGFEIIRVVTGNEGTPALWFWIYGNSPAVIPSKDSPLYREFSEAAGSLINVKSLESVSKMKNHVFIVGAKEYHDYYPPGTPSTVSGWDKKTLYVSATDIDSGNQALDWTLLRLRAIEALADANNRYVRMVDGEVPPIEFDQNNQRVFFNMGEIIWLRNRAGVAHPMQVTEIVTSIDGTGYQRTPAFSELPNV